MGDNRVQYAAQDRGQQTGIQYGGAYGAPQNGSPRQVRAKPARTKVKGEKEYYIRQQQQMQQKQKTMGRRLTMLTFFMCIMLLLNITAFIGMHFRMQRLNKALKLIVNQLSSGGAVDNLEEIMVSLGEEEEGDSPFSDKEGPDAPDSGIPATDQDYVNLCGLDYVDRPRERTMAQVLDRLGQLAMEDDRIAEILENSHKYPDKLLEALANNPEMTDFVMGYADSDGSASGTLTQAEMEQDFPLFLQWDPRWGYGEYGDGSNIGLAGCGPTCLSMALFYLTRDESLTPDKMAEYSMENGYYMSGTGTAWALLKDVPEQHGISVSQPKAEEDTMKAALDSGSVLICSMRPGDFRAAGHFIVIYGYDKTGFLVNDPNCVARSRQSWGFSELKKQIKNLWVLGGTAEKEGVLSEEGVTSVTDYLDIGKKF